MVASASDSIATSTAPGRRWAPLCVFLGCLALYHANGGKAQLSVDTVAAPYTAWALVRTGSADLNAYEDLREQLPLSVYQDSPSGGRVTTRPLGSTLAVLPIVAPFALFREQPFSFDVMGQLGKLAAAGCVAGATVFFFLLCRARTPRAVWPATILFAFGNCLWSVASQSIWMHGPAVFWLTWALYLLLRSPRPIRTRAAAVAGFALGMATLTRPTAGLFVVFTMLGLVGSRQWRSTAGLMLGGVVPGALLLASNRLLHGHWIFGGYHGDDWSMSTPLATGLTGLLFAPSRGLFVYTPALVLIPWGLAAVLRTKPDASADCAPDCVSGYDRWILLSWCGAALGTVVFFAKWSAWYGGWCFGPRFLCETMPILCLLFALAYESLRSVPMRRLAVSLVAVSVLVNAIGTFGRIAETEWYQREKPADSGWLFTLRHTQIETYARAIVRKVGQRLSHS
jgi:hypothetical protein